MEELFKTLSQAGDRAQGPLPGVGLHRRLASSASSERDAGIRDDAFAQLGDTDLADLPVAGQRAHVTAVTQVAATTPSDAQIIRDGRAARFTVPCYLTRRAARRARSSLYTDLDANTPTRDPGQHGGADVHVHRPALRRSDGAAARPSLYGHGLLGSQSEVGRRQRAARWPPSTTSCSARPTGGGMAQRGRPERRGDPGRPVELPDAAPTASSRGCSTSCTSAG